MLLFCDYVIHLFLTTIALHLAESRVETDNGYKEKNIYKRTDRKWTNSFTDVRFTCGITRLPYIVPIGWIARDGPNGKTNETLYQTLYKTVPMCCDGYTRNHEDICVPACKGGCAMGWCLRPNVCICADSDVLNKLGHCVPCACANGKCIDGACVCDEGYTLDNDALTCTPECNVTCHNAECTAPGECTCHHGYKMAAHSTHVCIPHCTDDCVFGKCVAPDTCICNPGYYKNRDLGVCMPYCDDCEHGVCVFPDKCVCQKGFKKQNGTCVPTCEGRCANGRCVGEFCACHHGYQKYDEYVCVPTCTPSCVHAWCTAPNHCECEDGYVPGSDTSMCFLPGVVSETHQILNSTRG